MPFLPPGVYSKKEAKYLKRKEEKENKALLKELKKMANPCAEIELPTPEEEDIYGAQIKQYAEQVATIVEVDKLGYKKVKDSLYPQLQKLFPDGFACEIDAITGDRYIHTSDGRKFVVKAWEMTHDELILEECPAPKLKKNSSLLTSTQAVVLKPGDVITFASIDKQLTAYQKAAMEKLAKLPVKSLSFGMMYGSSIGETWESPATRLARERRDRAHRHLERSSYKTGRIINRDQVDMLVEFADSEVRQRERVLEEMLDRERQYVRQQEAQKRDSLELEIIELKQRIADLEAEAQRQPVVPVVDPSEGRHFRQDV